MISQTQRSRTPHRSGLARFTTTIPFFGIVGLVGALAACHRPAQVTSEDTGAPVHVETADVTEVDAPMAIRLTGSLKGMKEADLAANASGRVMKTMVERGDEVKQGQILAQLDTSAATLALLEAKVQVATSKTQEGINQADCARYDQLRAKGAISALEYDQATAKCKTAPLTIEAAEARQNIAAKNVGDGTIRAPFAGIISERYVDVGEYVQPSSKVVSIAQIGDLRLEFTVPEANFTQVKTGSDVTFSVAAYPGKTFHGAVRFVSGAVRTSTRDVVAEAIVDNGERLLRPGMFADVSLVTGVQKLPSVPLSAVFVRQDKKRVYVVADGQLVERVLQPGPQLDGGLAVQDGVAKGEKVVTANLSALQNGMRVE